MNFIEKFKQVHGNKYDYSLVKYQNRYSEIEIICPKHGKFVQKPYLHGRGRGCPICGSQKSIQSHRSNVLEFTKKARKVHRNKYDYSLVDYVNATTKVVIICPIHGQFEQRPSDHLNNRGCFSCGRNSQRLSVGSTFERFVVSANIIHDYKYAYERFLYSNNLKVIRINCPNHGWFKQTIKDHLRGKGCPDCGILSSSNSQRSNTLEFATKAQQVHGNKYDYSLVNYQNALSKVKIICPVHGVFKQIPNNHLRGSGCGLCPTTISKGHQEIIDYVRSVYNGDIIINDRTASKPYELDIYVPNKSIAIEYHGLFYHSYDHQETNKERTKHLKKCETCVNNNIQLIQIFENEWLHKRPIIESMIKHKMNLTDVTIGARECVAEDCFNQHDQFMSINHIQGHRCAGVKFGLMYGGELVSCMTFSKHPKYQWEIIRFANKLGYHVNGGASKLFKCFVKNYNPDSILTYADRRYSNGNLYTKLGFKLDGITSPNYFYVKHGLFSRQQFQKHKLKNKLEYFDPNKSESENMFNNKYRRIWDAGHYRFIWRNK